MDMLTKLSAEKDALEAELAEINAELKPLRRDISRLDAQAAPKRQRMQEIRDEISRLNKAPRVSDHAVIRYLERHYGFDFEEVRGELLSDTVKLAMKAGAQSVKMNGGKLIIKGNTIVTYAP